MELTSTTSSDHKPQSLKRSATRKFERRRAATKIEVAIAASFAQQADFRVQHCLVVCGGSFAQLRVLILSGSDATCKDVEEIADNAPLLLKLDVSHCQLEEVPRFNIWETMQHLSAIFLHRNLLHRWEDLHNVLATPNLEWLTIHENPLASQPDVRGFIIAEAPRSIRAIDLMLVTDSERLQFACPFPWSSDELQSLRASVSVVSDEHVEKEPREATFAKEHISRFEKGSSAGILLIESKPQAVARPPQELLTEANQQLHMMKRQSLRCSAACLIQCFWRGHKARLDVKKMRKYMHFKVIDVQKNGRAFVWKQRMIASLKELLAEQGELELLLSAKEMLTIKARRLIERNVRRWVQQRKVRRRTREAATFLARCFRGHHQRAKSLEQFLHLNNSKTFYFPAEYIWEFRVVLNVILQKFNMDLVPNDQGFESSKFLALRIPQPQDIPSRNSALETVINFRNRCVMRPCRSGRFPEHQWDGPFHRIVDGGAPPYIKRAYAVVRQRGVHVPNCCRRAFLSSCVPGPHPIQKIASPLEEENGAPAPGLFFLQRLLDSPESSWPEGKGLNSAWLKLVLREARRQGARQCSWRPGSDGAGSMSTGYGATVDSKTGLKVYKDAVWLASPLLRYRCPSAELAQSLFLMLMQFDGTGGDAPLIRPVPFLVERLAMQAAAATTIQAAYRAHLARRLVGCGLLTALVLRRAALCLQRAWRWSILKRRLNLLSGALQYVRSITTKDLFIEDRLLSSLNFINSVDRYPPFINERSFHFGYSSIVGDIVFIREEMRGKPGLRDRFQSGSSEGRNRSRSGSSDDQLQHKPKIFGERPSDLPEWLQLHIPSLVETCPEDVSLVPTLGLQGLLHEGLGKPADSDAVTVNMASIEHMARLAGADGGYSCQAPTIAPSKAITASLGLFRFVNLKFPSVAHAKRRALLLFFGTWSARHRIAVPLLTRPMLQSVSVCEEILRLWDIYGLTWAFGDRTTVFQMRQRYCQIARESVSVCGQESSKTSNGREHLGDHNRPATLGLTTFDSPKANSRAGSARLAPISASSVSRDSLTDASDSRTSISFQGLSKLSPPKQHGKQRRLTPGLFVPGSHTASSLLSPRDVARASLLSSRGSQRGSHDVRYSFGFSKDDLDHRRSNPGTLSSLVKSAQLPALPAQLAGADHKKPSQSEANSSEPATPPSPRRRQTLSPMKIKAMRR